MIYGSFEQVLGQIHGFQQPKRVVLAGGEDEHGLEAVFAARKRGIVYPVIVGDKERIGELVRQGGYAEEPHTIVHTPAGANPSRTAVDIVNSGDGDFLMKGLIETKDFLKPVVDKANGLNTGGTISHFCLAEIPNYPKLIGITDGGVVINPTVEEKKRIIRNAVDTLRRMGYERPKVALLCGVETVNPKMQDTVDAAELVSMWKAGEIPDCDLAGPLSYDLALDRESARIKGVDCPWCGDFDVLIAPQLVTGNVLMKSWANTAGGKLGGIIVGARVPIVLASRSTDFEGKMCSLILAAACCRQNTYTDDKEG